MKVDVRQLGSDGKAKAATEQVRARIMFLMANVVEKNGRFDKMWFIVRNDFIECRWQGTCALNDERRTAPSVYDSGVTPYASGDPGLPNPHSKYGTR